MPPFSYSSSTRTRGTCAVYRDPPLLFWFVLIGLSPLLTHRHHLIDILGGFALAGVCFLFIRPRVTSIPLAKPLNRARP